MKDKKVAVFKPQTDLDKNALILTDVVEEFFTETVKIKGKVDRVQKNIMQEHIEIKGRDDFIVQVIPYDEVDGESYNLFNISVKDMDLKDVRRCEGEYIEIEGVFNPRLM